MNHKEKKELIAYLAQHVTPNKVEKIDTALRNRTRHVTVVLEDLFQEHNASAVVRSTECFGLQDLHVIESRNTFNLNSGVDMGSSKWLDINQYKTTEQCYASLKARGYRIVATTFHPDAQSLPNLPLANKLALVFGTEYDGLTEYALEHADEFMTIPMYGFTQSFNVSVSVAISLYQITSSLHSSSLDWHLSQEEIDDVKLCWYRRVVRASDELEKLYWAQKVNE